VFVDGSRLPRASVAGEQRMMTIAGLDELLVERAAGVTIETFLARLRDVSIAIAEETARTNRELPSRQRFLQTLEPLGVLEDLESTAEELSLRHMSGLASAIVCPPDRIGMLTALAERHRLALVSNFDHGPTARAVLEREGLLAIFDTVVISEESGFRKPAAEIFLSAAADLGIEPARCLHVGDSHRADVEGAVGAGMRAVWIRPPEVEESSTAETGLGDVRELPAWLEGRGP